MAKNETSFNCTSEPNSISNQIPEFTSSKIITLRGMQVILDKDLACCYQVETKRLNEQVRRNITRFPPQFMFQLTKEEWHFLRSQNATIDGRGRYSKYPPYAFTEYGVIMVGASLKDLGQKWFAVALLSAVSPNDLISRLNEHAISLDNSA